uniref:Uncharacterized protein n=1 Tax=Oncorhynchus tshawytscha TaxID=74940 RepID=A0A8C8GV04_ONCTS
RGSLRQTPSPLVLGQDAELRQGGIFAGRIHQNVGAGALEVKSLPIKGEVVGVAHGPAGCFGDVDTNSLCTFFLFSAFDFLTWVFWCSGWCSGMCRGAVDRPVKCMCQINSLPLEHTPVVA